MILLGELDEVGEQETVSRHALHDVEQHASQSQIPSRAHAPPFLAERLPPHAILHRAWRRSVQTRDVGRRKGRLESRKPSERGGKVGDEERVLLKEGQDG